MSLKKYCLASLFLSLFLVACNWNKESKNRFEIAGNIENANGDTLWLERVDIDKNVVLDSVVLKANGKFQFKQSFAEYPELYALRLKRERIILGIDSTLIININASGSDYSKGYKVTGSKESLIIQKVQELRRPYDAQLVALSREYRDSTLSEEQFVEQVQGMISELKKTVSPYIMYAPGSLSAYYTLFLRLGNYMLYNVYNSEDSRVFAAVATQQKATAPGSPRSKQLEQLTLQSLSLQHRERINKQLNDMARVVGSVDIELPNLRGEKIRLSSLKGKVVLLDFTVYQTSSSPVRNMAFAELYSKYKGQGLEIYQVSLDAEEHFWKVTADNLPWTSVYDAAGKNSINVRYYNVTKLPAYFLINREGDIVIRNDQMGDIEQEIKKLL